MSIATKQQQQSIHKPIRHQQQGSTTFTYNQQQRVVWNRKKSIESEVEVEVEKEHVTEKIKKSKQLLRQKPVALLEADEEQEVKTENKKAKSQSQEANNKIFKEIKDKYSVDLENGELKDYKIYQNGKVNEFFQNDLEVKPQKISDICLVNDHYILVKMPEQETFNNTSPSPQAAAAIRRQEFKALKEHNERVFKEPEKDMNKQFRRHFLRCKKNRITRITPIREEPEDCSDSETKTQTKLYCLKMKSCWQVSESDQIEIYDTQTKIHKSLTNSPQKQLTPSKLNTEQCTKISDKKSLDIRTISGDILKSSAHQNHLVNLHSYGSLIENANKNNNNNSNNNLENEKSPQRRKCPRLESFYWLLRPFRGKYRKAKPKIQAVVYKTYFVKWTKPPDTLSHGYGVKSPKSSDIEVSVLRRCRSAIF
ncbi:uncharacterized protein ACRADG_005257 isoform 1-T2 [Cochliomyia hominivorax]